MNVANIDVGRAKLESMDAEPALIQEMIIKYKGLMQAMDSKNQRISELYHTWQKAKDTLAAIGSDDEVARLEEQYQAVLG